MESGGANAAATAAAAAVARPCGAWDGSWAGAVRHHARALYRYRRGSYVSRTHRCSSAAVECLVPCARGLVVFGRAMKGSMVDHVTGLPLVEAPAFCGHRGEVWAAELLEGNQDVLLT